MAYFYRRRSGIFYARIRVPETLRGVLGSSDLRRTLNTSDYSVAARLALEVALGWKKDFQRIQAMIDAKKLTTGSPVLLTTGLISLADAADAAGLKVETLLREASARRSMLRLMADGWLGAEVPREELVNDDPRGRSLVLDVGETLSGRPLGPVFGALHLRLNSLAFVENGMFTDSLFFRDALRRSAVVAPYPGTTVPIGSLLIDKADAEAIRANLAAKVSVGMLAAHGVRSAPEPAAPNVFEASLAAVVEKASYGPAYKHKGTRTSTMLKEFYAAKPWAPATREQNERLCQMFVELMDDPPLGSIDREMIAEYRKRLMTVPSQLRAVKARNKGKTLRELIDFAAGTGLPTYDEARAGRYIMKIGEAFVWAAANDYMVRNPAANTVVKTRATVRAQDKRLPFSDAILGQIFGLEWYQTGKGQRTARGLYHRFQPLYYWLPLMGLYTGARINELSQLYLKDLVQTEAGTWFIDFNPDGEGKVDVDEQDDVPRGVTDKRLKTLNSIRIIPMHPELVRLGLPAYVQALRKLREARLFPELTHDRLKGYGKYAGQWFNERLMGRQLSIRRDSTQTFHSFRHTFLTACDRIDMPDRVRNEIAGHGRGDGQGHATYIKDRSADELAPFLSPLRFNLPPIVAFDVEEGIQSLRDAIARKQEAADRTGRRASSRQ
ncbi:site-specific integrase [Variovorax soli]|uniref:Integrase n=1 Tax=Variovorax soli TaxID=376815 RepID=A0ABU1NM35_9BURK|nr:site-specific integrase [Variovorax soli]MDR6539466.1 integrase [Variovorax soli]